MHKMAERPNSRVRQSEQTSENRAAKLPGDTGKESQRFLGATRWLTIWWFPETWKALLEWLRGNTQASVNQSRPKGKEEKRTGKKAEESTLQYIWEAVARGQRSLFCFNLIQWTEVILLGADALVAWSVLFAPDPHMGVFLAGALMGFMCLSCAHTILVGIVLSRKKQKGETLSHSQKGEILTRASLVAQRAKRLLAMQETWVSSLGQEDPLKKEMAIHSSTLAWKITWTEKPSRLQSMGSQRVGHDWATSLSLSLTHSSCSYFGCAEQWGLWTYQRWTLARVPTLLPQHLPVGRGSPVRKEKQRWWEETPSPWTSHQKCHGLAAGWEIISRHEIIWVWFFSFCILRPSLVLFALHSLCNHKLGRKNHFNYIVYTLYIFLIVFIRVLKV